MRKPPVPAAPGMKFCRICKKELPLSVFSKSTKNKDGLTCYCRACSNQRNHKYRLEHIEHVREMDMRAYLPRRYGIT